jgi:arylsulfatase A-like enzyme
VLWVAVLPFQAVTVRALLATALVAALAALIRRRAHLPLPPAGLAALVLGLILWWIAPWIGLDRMQARIQWGDGKPPPATIPTESRPPNLLLVVLDTVRADRLTPYDYARDTSPCLTRLASEGMLFEQAISAAPWTLPSHSSIFTGQFPSVHRATREHLFLNESIPTLAERVRERGYDTVGFSANVFVGPIFGLQRGFEDFALVSSVAVAPDDPFRRHPVFAALLSWLGDPEPLPDKGAGLENRLARRWLDGHMRTAPQRPFFMFVNYLEAHLPYAPAAGPRARFAPGPVRPLVAPLVSWSFSEFAAFKLIALPNTVHDEDYRQISDYYDASVASDDARLNELIQDFERRGLLDNTVVIVTSDHGENLGEHRGLLDHAFSVHQTLLHVPLIVRHPASFPKGVRYRGVVSTVSIFPTLLEEAGATPAAGWHPAVPPLPRTLATPPPPFAVSEYSFPISEMSALTYAVPGADVQQFNVRQRAIQDGRHKLVVRSDGGESVFDLAQDPGEHTPLSESDPAAVPLRAALGAWIASLPRHVEQPAADHLGANPETLRSLRALGYVR